MKTNPRVTAYIKKQQPFAQPILKYLREVVHEAVPECEETLKWSAPAYMHHGIVCITAGFKKHIAVVLWKGPLILDTKGKRADEAWGDYGRVASIEDLPSRSMLIKYLRKAAKLNEDGVKIPIRYSITSSAVGKVLVAASEKGVCAVSMGDSDAELERSLHDRFPSDDVRKDVAGTSTVAAQVKDMILGKPMHSGLKFDLHGTDFQKKVWKDLLRIPAGKTRSYAEIARRIGHPNAYRAVANACGANPVAIAVPCHRVIASGGKIGGYGGGLHRKRKLLANEGVSVSD